MRRALGAVALLVLCVACGDDPTTTDYQELAEQTAVESAEESNPGFTATASCDEPSSTDAGTAFECTITFDDGVVLVTDAVIIEEDGKTGVEIQAVAP